MLALQVVADVLHNDVNSEGTESARYTCPVQASHVKVALPKDVGTTVNVMKADGSPGGVFSVSAPTSRSEPSRHGRAWRGPVRSRNLGRDGVDQEQVQILPSAV